MTRRTNAPCPRPHTTSAASARATVRVCVATVLFALASGACDSARTFAAPTPPGASPPPALRITAFSAVGSNEGTTYVYKPTLVLAASAESAVTVTTLWLELQRGYSDQGCYFPNPTGPYRIPAGATLQLFANPPASIESDFDADTMWVEVSYVDDAGRAATVQASTTVWR